MDYKNILTNSDSTVHLVGIGGVSMSALAEAVSARGVKVRGSDMNDGVYTEHLKEIGIDVIKGHFSENVIGADIVIRTSAIKDDNPEIVNARKLGIPVLERTEAWGMLMDEFSEVVCVSGTHGKTSTTAMVTCIALAAEKDPEVMIGAQMREIGGVLRISDGDLFIAESCEYCNSFLNFNPTIAVVLNVEEDHLDFFDGIDDIINSFAKFISRTKAGGTVIVNGDDENAVLAAKRSGKAFVTFGLSEKNDVNAKNISYDASGFPMFEVYVKDNKFVDIKLSVLGEHNIKNALASVAVAVAMDIEPEKVSCALANFTGVGRRMEYKGECNGAKVYDDYAHHPSEIETTLKAVRKAHAGRVVCVFQPHTYTRTIALQNDFAKALQLADEVVLADIFAARENNTENIDSTIISDKIDGAKYISGADKVAEYLKNTVTSGDFVLTMGAGDIYKVGEVIVK